MNAFAPISLLCVALGGAFGSVLRYLVAQLALRQWPGVMPWGTLIVNVVGGFLIGWCANHLPRDSQNWLLLVSGFLGGFTTFSAFSLDTVLLFKSGHAMSAVIYIVLSVALSLGATAAALQLLK